MLTLARKLCAVDVETTGANPEVDRVVQVGVVSLMPDGKRVEWEQLVDPGIPIPPESTEVHGVTDEMVRGAPTFRALAPKLAAGFRDSDLLGYNLDFDLRCLVAEFRRASYPLQAGVLDGHRVDPFKVYKAKFPRDLTSAVREYCDREPSGAHNALSDARDALDVLLAQLARYDDLPRTPTELAALLEAPPKNASDQGRKLVMKGGEWHVNFGKKYNGRKLSDCDDGYLQWIIDFDFPPGVKAACKEELARRGRSS